MGASRRGFCRSAAGFGLILASDRWLAQAPRKLPDPPPPAEQGNPAEMRNARDPQAAKRAVLQQNEKDFRAGVEKLFQMASELRADVAKTVTTDVFSVRMFKRTEQIEKLAKELKAKVKG